MTTVTTVTTSNDRRRTKVTVAATTATAALFLAAALLATATAITTVPVAVGVGVAVVDGFSSSLESLNRPHPTHQNQQSSTSVAPSSRRDFFSRIASASAVTATAAGGLLGTCTNPSPAASSSSSSSTASSSSSSTASPPPQIYNLPSGIKYAVLKDTPKGKGGIGGGGGGGYPQPGDIVAIEYTGYLTSGQIFDASHSEGKNNALLFKLGSTAVIPGINEMVAEMKVGQKVQAIVPASQAFADKGVCLDDGRECLVRPGSTLVYDIYLKKASIPPP